MAANFASRTMRWTGVIVLLFLAWHLADLTWGWVNPDFVRGDVYDNVVASLERVPVALLYIVANIALGLHLFHGAGACSRAWAGTTPGSTRGGGGSPSASPPSSWSATSSFPIAVLGRRRRTC